MAGNLSLSMPPEAVWLLIFLCIVASVALRARFYFFYLLPYRLDIQSIMTPVSHASLNYVQIGLLSNVMQMFMTNFAGRASRLCDADNQV